MIEIVEGNILGFRMNSSQGKIDNDNNVEYILEEYILSLEKKSYELSYEAHQSHIKVLEINS